eukprot:GHRR01003369.1.p1 GENE.GHRR01003369.1~~GHRR01003369.1.p1  ORF type:complete len:888 (+),score=331.14 GHRR01003369.1:111-2774(+)
MLIGLQPLVGSIQALPLRLRRAVHAKSSEQSEPSTRRSSITERIEQLKRQNELLKQAVGKFLDKPQDVGIVTGKPTGTWDEGSTAHLLDQLRKRSAAVAGREPSTQTMPRQYQPHKRTTKEDHPPRGTAGDVNAASSLQHDADAVADVIASTDTAYTSEVDMADYLATVGATYSSGVDAIDYSVPMGTTHTSEVDVVDYAARAGTALQPTAIDAANSSDCEGINYEFPTVVQAGPTTVSEADCSTTHDGAATPELDPGTPVMGAESDAWHSSSNGVSSSAAIDDSSGSIDSSLSVSSGANEPVVSDVAAATGSAVASPAPSKPVPLGTIQQQVERMERKMQQQQETASKQHIPAVKPRATARRPPPACTTPLDIVFVSAEVAPWSKTGGLGDVMGALPQAMAARGHRVMVVAPRYTNGGKDTAKYEETKLLDKTVWVELNGNWHELKFHHCYKGLVDFVFLDHVSYHREGTPYGNAAGPFQDNLFRFALLCLGGLEAPLNLPIKRNKLGQLTDQVYGQDIMFVANDWHAALLPVLLAARFRPYNVYEKARCCLAIHNLAHQGSFEAHKFHDLGLPADWYGMVEWRNPEDSHKRRTINVLKAGIVTSDILVTVSQGYAAEITGMPQDNRVDMLLAQRAPRLRGIVNGIDTIEWDPATDKYLVARFSADDMSGKEVCKQALQREMRLPFEPDIPVIGFIGRLDYQKGPDLLLDALPMLANLDCQVVILGSGAPDYEARVKAATHDYGWFCRGHVGFSVPLSHKIIAGSDILLMPSRFEPCGLNQMYAMRYGTVPIAHATGGLTDTIHDCNPFSKGEGDGTGWTFAPAAVEPMVSAVSTAVEVYHKDPDRWRALQLRGMANDCSWRQAAVQYEKVLTEAMADTVQYSKKQ